MEEFREGAAHAPRRRRHLAASEEEEPKDPWIRRDGNLMEKQFERTGRLSPLRMNP